MNRLGYEWPVQSEQIVASCSDQMGLSYLYSLGFNSCGTASFLSTQDIKNR